MIGLGEALIAVGIFGAILTILGVLADRGDDGWPGGGST